MLHIILLYTFEHLIFKIRIYHIILLKYMYRKDEYPFRTIYDIYLSFH